MMITLPPPSSKKDAPSFNFMLTAMVCFLVFLIAAASIALLVRSFFVFIGIDLFYGVPLVMVLIILLGCYCSDTYAFNARESEK